MKLVKKLSISVIGSLLAFSINILPVRAQLDEKCVVNILNRTIQVSENGGWSLPNVPSGQGLVRARATCVSEDGTTQSGQSDYFTIRNNGITEVSEIVFDGQDPIPSDLTFSSMDVYEFDDINQTLQLTLTARFPDNSMQNVTLAGNGVNYMTTNANVAMVDENGVVTSVGNGFALISARKDGVLATRGVQVVSGGDLDGDGIPDDVEVANGLNPTDSVDALEDQDRDGLSALDEFNAGTDINVADTDGDGIEDGEELSEGEDGFITNPLLVDSDGDGLSDSVEVIVGSDPSNENDTNFAAAMVAIAATPSDIVLTFNGLDSEASEQLQVLATLIDGSELDITEATDTSYASSDLSVVSFGLMKGALFAGETGSAIVTVSNNSQSVTVNVTVTAFEPEPVSVLSIPGYANNVDVSGDYAFVAAGSAGLQVVDVSGDRESPSIVGSLDTDGTSIDVKLLSNIAYLADGTEGLKVIDVDDPFVPAQLGGVDTEGVAQDLKLANGYVYVADGTNGLQIVDIANPAEPKLLGQLGNLGEAKGVDVEGDIAVLGSTTGLHVIDVSNPRAPTLSGSVNVTNVKDVVVENGYAHVAAYTSGFRVVDLADPTNPIIVSQGAGFAPRDVAISGNLAFYAEQQFPNALAVVNIFDPTAAIFQEIINLSSLGDYAHTGIALDPQFAYVTSEFFFVGQDFGSSGSSTLMIAQYRDIADNEGIPPNASITLPFDGETFVQGEVISISADAVDDIFVANVDLVIDGVVAHSDGGEPYEFRYAIPSDFEGPLELEVRAIDFGGNVGSGSIEINVIPDPGTRAVGAVVNEVGDIVVGALVNCDGVEGSTNLLGEFSLDGVRSIGSSLVCKAEFEEFSGRSSPVTIVRDGVTDVGVIEIRSLVEFFGVQNDVHPDDLTGWEQCFSGIYTGTELLDSVLASCNRANLMLACRPVGAERYSVLAHAPRESVLFESGSANNVNNVVNGVNWYYSSSYSWGFGPADEPTSRNSCDTIDSRLGNVNGPTAAQRLCWHTRGQRFNGGWRCGTADSLNSANAYERVIYHAD